MTKKVWKSAPRVILSSLIPMLMGVGCAPVNQTKSENGVLSFKVKWPGTSGGLKIQGIPVATASIEITVTGEGLTEAVSQSLTRDSASTEASARMTLPLGSKTVLANAFDANQKLLATDSKSVTIAGGSTTQVVLDLQAVVPVIDTNVPLPVNLSPTAQPTSSGTSTTTSPDGSTTTVPLVNPTPFPNLNTGSPTTTTTTNPTPTTTTNSTTTNTSTSTSSSSTPTPTPPTFTALSANTAARGASLTLTGTGFSKVNTVFFNGMSASFVVVNDTTITATVPVGVVNGAVSVSNGFTTVTGPSFTVDPGHQFLVIDEIFANNDQSSKQFIEIRNTSNGLYVDPTGLQVTYTEADSAGTQRYYQIPTVAPIAPGGKLWVRVNEDGTNSNTEVFTGNTGYGDIRFDNTGAVATSYTEVAICKQNPCAATGIVDYVQWGIADASTTLEAAAVTAGQWIATQFVNITDYVVPTDASNTGDGTATGFKVNTANNTGTDIPVVLQSGEVVIDNIQPGGMSEGKRLKRTVTAFNNVAGSDTLNVNAPIQANVQASNTNISDAAAGLTVDNSNGFLAGDPIKFRGNNVGGGATITSVPSLTSLRLSTFIGTNPGSNTSGTADGVTTAWNLATITPYFSAGDDVNIFGFTRSIVSLPGGNTMQINATLDVPILASNLHDGVSPAATDGIALDGTSANTANMANTVDSADRVIIAGENRTIASKQSGNKLRLSSDLSNLSIDGTNTGRGNASSLTVNLVGTAGLFTVGSKVHFKGRTLSIASVNLALIPGSVNLSDNLAHCTIAGGAGPASTFTFTSCADGLTAANLFGVGDTVETPVGSRTITAVTGMNLTFSAAAFSLGAGQTVYLLIPNDGTPLRHVPVGLNAKLVPHTGGSPLKLIPKSGDIVAYPSGIATIRRIKAFKSVQFDGTSSYNLVAPTPNN